MKNRVLTIIAIALLSVSLFFGLSPTVNAALNDGLWQERFSSYVELIWNEGRDVLIRGTNKYLNFGTTAGTSGYGFRDNGGTMQVKNSGGAWANFGGAGGGGSTDQLGQIGDVNTTTLSTNDILYYDGLEWLPTATTSWDTDTTCDGASCDVTNTGTLDGFEGADFLTLAGWYATTTDGLTEGSTNKYFADQLVADYILASTTITLNDVFVRGGVTTTENINIASDKEYRIGGNSFLAGSASLLYAEIGPINSAGLTLSSAIGVSNTASGFISSSIGVGNTATAGTSVSIGYGNNATSGNAIAIGRSNNAGGAQSAAIGYTVNAYQAGAVAFGSNFTNNVANTVMLGNSSGQIVVGVNGNIGIGTTSPYAELSVDGDIVSTGNITGTWQGTAIDISSYTNLTAGRSLTLSADSVVADAELYTDIKSFNYASSSMTTSTAAILSWQAPQAATVTEITCNELGSAGTSTIMFEERTAINTAGTNILYSGGLYAGADIATATSTIPNAGIAANAYIVMIIDGVAGSPKNPVCDVEMTYDD